MKNSLIKLITLILTACIILSFAVACSSNVEVGPSENDTTEGQQKAEINVLTFSEPFAISEDAIMEIMTAYLSDKDASHRDLPYRVDCFWASDGIYYVDIRNCAQNADGFESVSCTDGTKVYSYGKFYCDREVYELGIIDIDYYKDCYREVLDHGCDFADNCVLLTVSDEAFDKVFTKEDFAFINCIDVKKIRSNSVYIVKLTLADHSKLRVVEAIKKLQGNPDFTAEPSYIYNAIDDPKPIG